MIRRNTKFRQGMFQVSETTLMRILVAIDDLEHLSTARREQEIMFAHRIRYYAEHDIASVRVELMPFREKNRFSIVDGSAGREIFKPVMKIVANEIGHLLALDIDDFQKLTFLQRKGYAASRSDDIKRLVHYCRSVDISIPADAEPHCIDTLQKLLRNRLTLD